MIPSLDFEWDNPCAHYIHTKKGDTHINNKTYNELKSNYYNILKQLKELIQELKVDNSMQVNIIFSYLLWYGFLSKDNKLQFDCNNYICLENMDGISIITGKSKCLNNAEMLKDLHNIIGNKSNTVICYMPQKSSSKYNISIGRDLSGKT